MRHYLRGGGEEMPRPLAFVRQQPADGVGDAAGAQRLLGDAESCQILLRQIDSAALEIDPDVANDVGDLQREAEVEGVFSRSRVAAAEDLDADQPNRGRHAAAIADQLV